MPQQTLKQCGFLKGRTGLLAVGAMIEVLLHNPSQAQNYTNEINQFIKYVNTTFAPGQEEGLAGLLATSRILNDFYVNEVGSAPVIPSASILKVGQVLFQRGL